LLMPCGGIRAENVARIVRATRAQEFHSAVGISSEGNAVGSGNGNENDPDTFERRVRQLVCLIEGLS
jgi:copper homeostasis protein CutC